MKEILLILTLITITFCLKKREPMLKVQGFVIEQQYVSETLQTAFSTGFSASGTLTHSNHIIHEKEKYITIIKCKNSIVFSVNSTNVYGKLAKGDNITIYYYEMVDSDGNVRGYEFVDAQKTSGDASKNISRTPE